MSKYTPLEYLARVRKDPWFFLTELVFTQDQVDKENPIKAFPAHYEYLKLYVKLWQRHPKILVPKSRRMFMSWTNIGLYLWDTMFNIGRHNAFVSKKEEDSDVLVQRAKFILEHIPEEKLPKQLIPRWTHVIGRLNFHDTGSIIEGYPQGSDQLRQHTFSGLFADEMAFWEEAEKMYSSAFPTLEGGGRFTGVSSPAPGFFKQMVMDQLDKTGLSSKSETDTAKFDSHFPMDGVELRINPKNKFLIFQLHYSADPRKKDPKYRDYIRSSMPYATYMQEYELNWDTYTGQPVFPDFNRTLHGSKTRIDPVIGLPLLRGWDFGLTPACVVAQLVEDQLRVIKEFTAMNMGAERFSELVLSECRSFWPRWADPQKAWRDFIDPAGEFRKDDQEGACAQVLADKGLVPISGPVAWEPRRQGVEKYLHRVTKQGPAFLISLVDCPVVVRGFEGGYRYPESAFDLEPGKIRPLKDEHSHPHDALQYICSTLGSMAEPRRKTRVPTPSYFSSGSKERQAVG